LVEIKPCAAAPVEGTLDEVSVAVDTNIDMESFPKHGNINAQAVPTEFTVTGTRSQPDALCEALLAPTGIHAPSAFGSKGSVQAVRYFAEQPDKDNVRDTFIVLFREDRC
jgi:hypothetical protein